jgi:hypothetical protein
MAVPGHANIVNGSVHLQVSPPYEVADIEATLFSDSVSIVDAVLLEKCTNANSSPDRASAGSKKESTSKINLAHYAVFETESFTHDKPSDIAVFNNLTAARDPFQSRITYILVAEFNPPDLSYKDTDDFRYPKQSLPWFVALKPTSTARISGWKDSNSLYKSLQINS